MEGSLIKGQLQHSSSRRTTAHSNIPAGVAPPYNDIHQAAGLAATGPIAEKPTECNIGNVNQLVVTAAVVQHATPAVSLG